MRRAELWPVPWRLRERPAIPHRLVISEPVDRQEQDADRFSRMLNRGTENGIRRHAHAKVQGTNPHPTLPPDTGRPLSATLRGLLQSQLGVDLSAVTLHDSPQARQVAGALEARAFTDGSHIWLGPGASEHDRDLLGHELAHVLFRTDDRIYLRRATGAERRAWLAIYSHYLPRTFLNNYMDDTGAAIKLSQQEMSDCNPIVDLRRSSGFVAELATLQAAGGGTKAITVSGWGGALTNGTLGNFTIHYSGILSVAKDGAWQFSGAMNFYDFWDFDPKPFGRSGRPFLAELKVRIAAATLPGKPFAITSVDTPVQQGSGDARAAWAGGTPVSVPERKATAADIVGGGEAGEAGGAAMGVGGAEAGAAGGAEAGAQGAADTRRK